MNLRYLQTFVDIAEAGSIARAGARLNVSQPASKLSSMSGSSTGSVDVFG